MIYYGIIMLCIYGGLKQMTAEIAVMNKRAIALAADSAVTIGDRARFYNTANKLFMLSKFEPIGIMIYNNAEFMGVPWEVIVKEYRSYIDNDFKDHVSEYANNFFSFMLKQDFGFKEYEKEYYEYTINSFLSEIRTNINNSYSTQAEDLKRKLTNEEIIEITTPIADNYFSIIDSASDLDDIPVDILSRIENKYASLLEECIDRIIGVDVLSIDSLEKIKRACNSIFLKDIFVDAFSGIVIAGFGKKDIFPSLFSYNVSGYIEGYIKKQVKENVVIDNENDYKIIPFAQTDTVETFLYGVNSNYLKTLDKEFCKQIIDEIENLDDNIFKDSGKNILKNELVKKWSEVIKGIINYSQEEYLIPILKAIRVLPIDELASMAESLVNLTSFRRQVAMDNNSQTVGGPIDVAVISKGDGFIWIKRKHYFKPELNHHFFNNYYKSDCKKEDDENEKS